MNPLDNEIPPAPAAGRAASESEAANRDGGFRAWLYAWRYFFGLLGLLLIPPLYYAEENWRGARAWANYRQERIAKGDNLDPKALIPPPVNGNQNFAATPTLAPLFDFLPGTQTWRDPNALKNAQAIGERFATAARTMEHLKSAPAGRSNSWSVGPMDVCAWHAAFLAGTNLDAKTDLATERTNHSEAQAAAGVLAALAELGPVLDELRTASRLPRSRFNLHYEEDCPAAVLLPHLTVLKRFSQILELRASAELALGQTNEAFNDVLLILGVADAIREEPILISQLVRISQLQMALQPLREGMSVWSDAQLQEFTNRLQRIDLGADMRHALEGERTLFGGGVIRYVRRSVDRGKTVSTMMSGGGPSDLGENFWKIAPNGWFDFEAVNYDHFFQTALLPTIDPGARRISPEASRRAMQQLEEITKSRGPSILFRHQFFSALLLPAISNAARRAAREQTAIDLAGLACGLERYRRVHAQYPATLAALSPDFAVAIPHDIINGEPLHYKLEPDGGYALYSVGWNETDEGGEVALRKSAPAPDADPGDWVWRPK